MKREGNNSFSCNLPIVKKRDIFISKRSFSETSSFFCTGYHTSFYISCTSIVIELSHPEGEEKHKKFACLFSEVFLRGSSNSLNMPLFEKSKDLGTICIISGETTCFIDNDIIHFLFSTERQHLFEVWTISALFCTCRFNESFHKIKRPILKSSHTSVHLRFEGVLLFVVSVCRFTTINNSSKSIHGRESYFGNK